MALQEKLTDEEIELAGLMLYPPALIETLFPVNMKAPGLWAEVDCPLIQIRNYQFAMLSYDLMHIDDPLVSDKENFRRKKGMGDCFNIAARDLGKSWCLIWDSLTRFMYGISKEFIVASFDQGHLRDIFEPICKVIEHHPIFKLFQLTGGAKKSISRSPYRADGRHGCSLKGINEKVHELHPGENFHGIHAEAINYEEFSYASPEGTQQRVDSKNDGKQIERYSGIPDIKIGSPLGDILRDPSKKNFVCRLPQFVKDSWDEQTREEKEKEYKGKSSMKYKVMVLADLIEGEYSKFDMNRIRKGCLIYDEPIKFFELNEQIFQGLERYTEGPIRDQEIERRIAEKLPLVRYGAEKIIISSDIGTTGSQSEVAIFFGDIEGKYKYQYQISLFNMTTIEQGIMFAWLYRKMGTCFVSLDCSNADGRSIREQLSVIHKIPEAHLMDFRTQKNIEVGFELDDDGKVKREKSGKPIVRVENTKAWAVSCLEDILYNAKLQLCYDEKLLEQLACFYENNNNGRLSWGSSTEEHLLDSFFMAGLTIWFIGGKGNENIQPRRSLGYI